MPLSSKVPLTIPQQSKAAIVTEYLALQKEQTFELFGPNFDFQRLLYLHRALNEMERRAPWLKQEPFLQVRRGRLQ